MHDTTTTETTTTPTPEDGLYRMADENDAYANKLEALAREIDNKDIPRLSGLVEALEDGVDFFSTCADELRTEADRAVEGL